MKKKFLLYPVLLAGGLFLLQACDLGELTELNKNPNQVEEVVPEYMFTNALLSGVAPDWTNDYRMYGQSMQMFATYFEVTAPGDKYFNDWGARTGWTYTGALFQNDLVMRNTTAPEDINKYTAARIWKVYLFHHVTDLFGDVPYSEALKAQEGIYEPKYDRQEFIYTDMLNELDEAVKAFDPSKPTLGSADLFYGGNIDQWKKFAYSLMLRLGMRLSERDPVLAEKYVRKAIEGGVILYDEDVTKVFYEDGPLTATRNPKAVALVNGDFSNPQTTSTAQGSKYAKTFIDHLQATNDPRLEVFAMLWMGPEGEKQPYHDPAIQRGMENGVFNVEPDDFETYSEPRRSTILNYAAPVLVMTNAETHLLLAEAALRGWYDGDEEFHYNEAVRAGMRQWADFGEGGSISSARIEQYLAENPYNVSGSKEERLEQISVQKWVSLFLDFKEIYANWRRTGYPALTPTNYPGNITGGQIPRRRIIPESEERYNEKNMLEAIERQGVGNDLMSTVWWDPMYDGNP